jgi:DNA-directed RNA polymerase sigma subunit (sigma70/sigma32)
VSSSQAKNINNVLNTKHIYNLNNINKIKTNDDSLVTNLLDLEISLSKLNSKESTLIVLYYGLNTGEGKSIKEMGIIYKTSKENIRKKINTAMSKLRILMM